MLKFINKKGHKVMELHDNGELDVLQESLKKTFENPVQKDKEEADKEDKKDNE